MTEAFTQVEFAAEALRRGGIVAFATETVYGLGARCDDPIAVAKIFAAKGRPSDNPLIVHCADPSDLQRVCRELTPAAQVLLAHFAPGPLTVVLPKHPSLTHDVTGGLDTVAVRLPNHPQALALIKAVGIPLVAPSANRSGRPSPTTWQAVWEDLNGRIDGVLVGDPTSIGVESTVVDCTTNPPCVLRHGGVTLEQMRAVIPEIESSPRSAEMAKRSPGLRYRHYSPNAQVILFDHEDPIEATDRAAFLSMTTHPHAERFAFARCYRDIEAYARDVFEAFRCADRMGLERIYCERVEPLGIGKALMDRLERAAN